MSAKYYHEFVFNDGFYHYLGWDVILETVVTSHRDVLFIKDLIHKYRRLREFAQHDQDDQDVVHAFNGCLECSGMK
jgi:hypothetical protein